MDYERVIANQHIRIDNCADCAMDAIVNREYDSALGWLEDTIDNIKALFAAESALEAEIDARRDEEFDAA